MAQFEITYTLDAPATLLADGAHPSPLKQIVCKREAASHKRMSQTISTELTLQPFFEVTDEREDVYLIRSQAVQYIKIKTL